MSGQNTILKHFPVDESKDLKEVKYVPTDIGKFKAVDGDHKPDTFFLYFTVVTGCLSMLTGASNFAWPSPVLPKLISNDTTINPLDKPISTMDISMLTGLPALTGIPGALVLAPLSDKIGRKKCLQISLLGMIVCIVVTAFSNKVIYMIVSRCIFFVFFSGILTIVPPFVTEICEDHNRAKVGCIMQIFPPAGSLYAFVFGPILNVRNFTLVLLVPAIMSLIGLVFTPETPFYLLSQGKTEECRRSLKKLRSSKNDKEIEMDMNKLYETLKSVDTTKKIGVTSMIKIKEARIGFILAFTINLLFYVCGAPLLLPFIGPIFNNSGTGISGDMVGIMVAVLKCLLFFTTSLIVERCGRKPLLFISAIGCGVTMSILSWYFYLEQHNSPLVNQFGWLPIIVIILYFVSYSFGLGSIPLSLIGEMFIIELRSKASACIATILAVFVFIITSGIPILTKYVGVYLCFGIFATNCLLGAVFIYCMLPETRGKSLLEIQGLLRNYKFSLGRKT